MFTAAGKVFEDGVVVIRAGRIEAVGPRDAVPVPPGIPVLPAAGRSVIPGLVEIWSDIPRDDPSGGQPDLRGEDLLDPFNDPWRTLLSEGITTAAVAPAPRGGIGGLGSVAKLRGGRPGEPCEPILSGSHLVAALGLVPAGSGSPRISTADRLEQHYALRQRFVQARDYRKAWNSYWEAVEKYNREAAQRLAAAPGEGAPAEGSPASGAAGAGEEKKPEEKKPEEKKSEEKKSEEKKPQPPQLPRPPDKPALDIQKEVLLRALDGKLPVLAVAHRLVDIQFALKLREEFGLALTVLGATEGRRLAADLARARAPVALGPALLTRWDLDLEGHRESNGAELSAAGVPVALSGLGGGAFPSRALRLEACVLARGGLPAEQALRAVTAEPANILGLGKRIGTIEPGKDGDLAILDGDPLAAPSRVVRVVIGGTVVFGKEEEL